MRVSVPCIATFLALFATVAPAQTTTQDAAIDSALACRSIADPASRLECLDKAAAAIAETRIIRDDDSEIETAAEDRMDGFGAPSSKRPKPRRQEPNLDRQSPDKFGEEQLQSTRAKKAQSNRQNKLEDKVIEVRVNSRKRATLTLANGQSWRQLESDDISLPLRDGKLYTVVIKRSVMGNYLMRVNELKRTIRVRRIR